MQAMNKFIELCTCTFSVYKVYSYTYSNKFMHDAIIDTNKPNSSTRKYCVFETQIN